MTRAKRPRKDEPNASRQKIVSSAHLMSPQSAELSEFEYGLIVSSNAFSRWVVH